MHDVQPTHVPDYLCSQDAGNSMSTDIHLSPRHPSVSTAKNGRTTGHETLDAQGMHLRPLIVRITRPGPKTPTAMCSEGMQTFPPRVDSLRIDPGITLTHCPGRPNPRPVLDQP